MEQLAIFMQLINISFISIAAISYNAEVGFESIITTLGETRPMLATEYEMGEIYQSVKLSTYLFTYDINQPFFPFSV